MVGAIHTNNANAAGAAGGGRGADEAHRRGADAGQGRSFVVRNNARPRQPAARKTVTRVTCEPDGNLVLFRVWTLAAYDGDACVLVVDQDYGNNKAKFDAFMRQLDAAGYAINYEQYQELNSKLLLDICVPSKVTNSALLNQILLYGFGRQPLSWQAAANSKMLAR
eukprot:2544622-Rhodomonas_salina.1